MWKFLRFLVALAGIVILVALAVSNRDMVEVSFFPLPFTYETYLFAIFFAGLVIGALIGWLAQVFAGHDRRVEARKLRRRYVAEEVRADVKRRQEEEDAAKKVRDRQRTDVTGNGRPLAISAPSR